MHREGWHIEGADDDGTSGGCGLRVSGISLGPAAFYFRQRWVFSMMFQGAIGAGNPLLHCSNPVVRSQQFRLVLIVR